jgi:serpin B
MTAFATSCLILLCTLTAARSDLLSSQRKFADDLTLELYTNDNECSSAFGVSMAFSLVYPSATGSSETQIRNFFGYPTPKSTLVWEEITTRLDEANEGTCVQSSGVEQCAPQVEIANRIYFRSTLTGSFDSSYQAVVEDYLQPLDFDSPDAGSEINSWVSGNTNELIESMVPDGPLPGSWILVALNALYLKASWYYQFQESKTNEDKFYSSASRSTAVASTAHFMHQKDSFKYSHDALPGFQVVQLPFAGLQSSRSSLSMIVALPISDWSGVTTSSDVISALPSLRSAVVALAIPKFKFESEYEDGLKDSLIALGLVAPFSGGLCVLADICDALIDVIKQKTVIDVNEKGVEAAAVTLIAVGLGSAGPLDAELFLADHPFQFYIYDEDEDVVLFEGRVRDPGIPDGSTAPLTQSHNANNFWQDNFYVQQVRSPPSWPPCFPGHASVHKRGVGNVAMQDIGIGDYVLTGPGKFEPVYSFGHAGQDTIETFVQISTRQGNKIELTSRHMLFVKDRGYIPASSVAVGDFVVTGNSDFELVKSVGSIRAPGAYAPMTPSGKILVDNILCSTYMDVFEVEATGWTLGSRLSSLAFASHWMAHTALLPLRLACHYLGSCPKQSYNEDGVAFWAVMSLGFAKWLLKQHLILGLAIFVPLTFLLVPCALVEYLLMQSDPLAVTSLVTIVLSSATIARIRAKRKSA